MSLCPWRTAKGHFFFALRDMRAAPMNAGGQFYAENKMVSCIRRSSPRWSTGPAGSCFTGEGCSDVAFPRDIGSPILTKHFTRWSNSPNCQVTGRKVRSWNVIVLFSHCPTPPDVFMIRRKLPRHKDAIYDRQKTIRLRPCEPESYCLPLRMSLSVF